MSLITPVFPSPIIGGGAAAKAGQDVASNLNGPQAKVKAAADKYGISPNTLWGVYGTESAFGTNNGPSSAGALGPFQFMPSTAQQFGIDPNNFDQAVDAAAKYLKQLGANNDPNSPATFNALNKYNGNGGGTSKTKYVSDVLANGKKFGLVANLPGADTVQAISGTVSSVGDFLGLLVQPSTWFRVGKGALGGVLIIVGVGGLVFMAGKPIARQAYPLKVAARAIK